MSIFTKPSSRLETADLQELLDQGAVENVRLEFKLQIPDKEDTLKKLSSFANTFGGFMVIGARASSTDGRIQDLPGVEIEAGYKQKVVQWCFDGASPPLVVEVSDPVPVTAGNGKVCYVAYAAESDVAPHFLNGRRGIWVRTDEFSARFEARLANENELRHLLDRRKLVREHRARLLERARRRFTTFLAKLHTDASGNPTKSGPLLELCVVPRFPARKLCQQEKLQTYLRQNGITWRQVLFPDPGRLQSQHESAIVLNPAYGISFLEVNVWGTVFYGAQLDSPEIQGGGIPLYGFVGYVLAFISHAAKMLEVMGYSGPVVIETNLRSILSVPWHYTTSRGFGFLRNSSSELDDEVAFSTSTTSEALLERPDAVAMEVLRDALFSVNFPDLVATPQKLGELVRMGYQYNFWPIPESLQD